VTLLATNLEELITRDPGRFMRSLEQEMNSSEQLCERWCRRMSQIAGNCHYISQQDCAPPHNSKRWQDWLKESLTQVCETDIWPSSSPDCNHLDCITLGVSGSRINLKPHNKTEDLIQRIKEMVGSLDRETVAKASNRFRCRIKAMIIADGHFVV
jgi:hypothetical protein